MCWMIESVVTVSSFLLEHAKLVWGVLLIKLFSGPLGRSLIGRITASRT